MLRATGYARALILETYDGTDPIQTLTAARGFLARHLDTAPRRGA